MALEQEVKLQYANVEAARSAVMTAGGRLVCSRRLIDDQLFDTANDTLRSRGTALRLRRDGSRAAVTWKGPAERAPVKSREELETTVGDPVILEAILRALGYAPRFRSQKYREDYTLGGAAVVIDETPVGVFVEIEGTPELIATVAKTLGRTPADYRVESYPTLWQQWCEAQGRPAGDMLLIEGNRP